MRRPRCASPASRTIAGVRVPPSDVNDLNSLLPSELRFFRINYEFDLNAMGQGLSENTPTVELDFFRLPFVF